MNEKEPNKTVSVIVPCYNVEHYVSETLDSILAQTYPHLEIIVVNDGSTDGTKSVLRAYSASHATIVYLEQENKGLSAARNTGFSAATGEYLCIFDADDIMVPEKVAEQVRYMKEHPECGVVYSDVYHFLDGTKKIYAMSLPKVTDVYRALIEYGNFINPNSVLFRRSVYATFGGFDEGMKGSEDWDHWMLLSRQGVQFCHLAMPLTLYRVRESGLSGNRPVVYATGVVALERQAAFVTDAESRQRFDSLVERWNTRLYIAYLQSGRMSDAKQYMNNSFLHVALYALFHFLPRTFGNYLFMIAKRIKFHAQLRRVTDSGFEHLLK